MKERFSALFFLWTETFERPWDSKHFERLPELPLRMSLRRAADRILSLVIVLPLAAVSSAVIDPVLLNQALAVALCGVLLLVWSPGPSCPSAIGATPRHGIPSTAWGVTAVLGIVAAFDVQSRWSDDAWLVELGVVVATAAMHAAACMAVIPVHRPTSAAVGESTPTTSFAWGWWAAGGLCVAIAALQYFVAEWARVLADAGLLASNSASGRAIGNMRQPNHLATALVCAMVWSTWLWQTRRLPAWAAGSSIAAMVLAVALCASRTGALSLAVLLLWAAADHRLPRGARWLLVLTPLIYVVCWLGLTEWAVLQQGHYYGAERLQSSADPSSSRFAIWRNALVLIAQNPWTGVGWGNFNFAWTFTPFPDRPVAFFDHTHNLPLQLAVEIGLPATALVLGLFGWALWNARGAWRVAGEQLGHPARAAFVMLVVLGVHSLLEYPLWYAYFLLPAAWALGVFLGSAPTKERSSDLDEPASPATTTIAWWPPIVLRAAGALMVAGAAYAVWDHHSVEVIFAPPAGAGPLAERIAAGRESVLFGHHADYAAVTNEPKDQMLGSFRRPLHHLVDVRLLIAYIEALRANGRDAEALYAAQRLREFRRDDAQAYFKDCVPENPTPPFQCTTTPVPLTWRDLEP